MEPTGAETDSLGGLGRCVCSFNEGGLGLRTLKDTVYGLQGKLAWKVFGGHTLWARILRKKYGVDSSRGEYSRSQSASALWRQMYPHFQTFQGIGKWSVGEGKISFWRSNWLGQVLDQTNSSHITVREGLAELAKWKPAMNEEQWANAQQVTIDAQTPDELCCTLNAVGKFRVADYIEYSATKERMG